MDGDVDDLDTLLPKRLKQLAALALIASPLAFAASAQADRPSGSDFTQALPDAVTIDPAGARAAARYRTPPVRAPRRFDLVGVAGQTGALGYRTRRAGGSWGSWVLAEGGEPVYAGGADWVQVRSRVPISGELHYVTIDDGSVGAARLLAQRRKQTPGEPRFITRAQWGANAGSGGCPPRQTPETGRIKAGVIHHTVSTNTYTEAQAPGIVLAICRYHRNANGWNDIGYNALVDRFGNLYEGRAGGLARPIVGAQAEGINSQTTGIASIGDNREFKAPRRERDAFADYFAWKFSIAGIGAEGATWLTSAGGSTQRTPRGERVRVPRIFSHNYTNITACAGAALIRQIPKIRRAVARRLAGAGVAPPATGRR